MGHRMARILVIDDETETISVLDPRLRAAGHEVATGRSGGEGLRLARELEPDLVLMELSLPDLGGTEVFRALREGAGTKHARVIILSSRSDEIDRVVGFELGADDYVVKPFSVRELLLRIRAVLRRGDGGDGSRETFDLGLVRVDREAHRVWVAGEEVELTALEFRLLVALHDRRHQVATRESLLETVWGFDSQTTTRTVDALVKRLREKLGDAGSYVETVRKVGYRLADPATGVARRPNARPGDASRRRGAA